MGKEKIKDPSGISVGLSLIIIGVVVQFVFLEYGLVIWVATFLIGFGIFGLGVEVDKIAPEAGYANLGLGMFAIMLGVLTLNYFDLFVMKILAMIILLFGTFGLINGLIQTLMFENKAKKIQEINPDVNPEGSGVSFQKIINAAVSISAFLSNVSTIISNFGG